MKVVGEHAQWWNPELKSRPEASRSSVVEDVDAATSAWVADEFYRVFGRASLSDEVGMYFDLEREAEVKELGLRRKFGYLNHSRNGAPGSR